MHPHLEECRDRVRESQLFVRDRFADLSIDQLNWNPGEGSWSIRECLLHLVLTDSLYCERLEKATSESKRSSTKSTRAFLPDFIGKILISAVSPQNTRRVKTFGMFRPSANMGNLDPRDAFLKSTERVIDCIRAADGFDLTRTKIASPVSRLVRLNLGSVFEAITQHQKRHLLQAENVLQDVHFPAALADG